MDNGNPKFGSLINWGSIFQTGFQSFAPIVAAQVAGGPHPGDVSGASCNHPLPMHGQGQIAGCLDSIWTSYRTLGASGATPEDLLAFCQRMAAQLSDAHTFVQGDSYLQQMQANFRSEITRISALIAAGGGSAGASGSTIDPATGQPILTQPITATNNSNLYLIGGAALVALLLLRR